jgi:hypothetical protein
VNERARIKQAALVAAQTQGCVCHPIITLEGGGGLFNARLEHDDWCPLYRSLQEHDGARTGPTGPIVVVPPGWEPS